MRMAPWLGAGGRPVCVKAFTKTFTRMRFVNIQYCKTHRSSTGDASGRRQGEVQVAGDATQVQSTNEKNHSDRIRHHSDVGGRYSNRAPQRHAHESCCARSGGEITAAIDLTFS